MSRQIKPRVVIVMDGGVIQSVHCEGLPDADLIQVITVDYDAREDRADPKVVDICGDPAWVGLTGFESLDDHVARDVFAHVDGLTL